MDNLVPVKSEWFFLYESGLVVGPLANLITAAGLGKISEQVESFSCPYLVVGDDIEPGETIAEVFRRPVSVVTRSGNVVRFRTQLLPSECNGDHQKVSIFIEGTDLFGSGIMFNLLKQPWSKANNTALTVECRITVQGV